MSKAVEFIESVLAGASMNEAISKHILLDEAPRPLHNDVTDIEKGLDRLRNKIRDRTLKNLLVLSHAYVKSLLDENQALARRSLSNIERSGKSVVSADLGSMLDDLEQAKNSINSIRVGERTASDFIGDLFFLLDLKHSGVTGRSLDEALSSLTNSTKLLTETWFSS